MSALLALLLAAPDATPDLFSAYRQRTRAEPRCEATSDENEVVVCGRRDADRDRVPLLVPTASDIDRVPAHTARMLDPHTFSCGITGPFLTPCGGMVGVTMSVGFDGKVGVSERPLAR